MMAKRLRHNVTYEVFRGRKSVSLPFFNKKVAEEFSNTVNRLNPKKSPTHVRKMESMTITPKKSRKKLNI